MLLDFLGVYSYGVLSPGEAGVGDDGRLVGSEAAAFAAVIKSASVVPSRGSPHTSLTVWSPSMR